MRFRRAHGCRARRFRTRRGKRYAGDHGSTGGARDRLALRRRSGGHWRRLGYRLRCRLCTGGRGGKGARRLPRRIGWRRTASSETDNSQQQGGRRQSRLAPAGKGRSWLSHRLIDHAVRPPECNRLSVLMLLHVCISRPADAYRQEAPPESVRVIRRSQRRVKVSFNQHRQDVTSMLRNARSSCRAGDDACETGATLFM